MNGIAVNFPTPHALIYTDGRHRETVFSAYSSVSVICFIQ